MEQHELEAGSRCSREFCDRVGKWAREVDFRDGRVVAKRHHGLVKRIKLRMADPDGASPVESLLVFPEMGLVRAGCMLRDMLQEALPPCIVYFGDVKIRLSAGALDEVSFAEKFRIGTEFLDLVRYIDDSLRRARCGRASSKTRVGRRDRPR